MLNIKSADNMNACSQEILDVPVAFSMLASRDIGMG